MDETKALTIVSALANGVNPLTGEIFSVDSPYQSPDVVRALYVSLRALEARARQRPRSRERMPGNAGKPWSEDEDKRLLDEFERGRPLAELARAHERTQAGIQARLERHGRVPFQEASRYSRISRRETSARSGVHGESG